MVTLLRWNAENSDRKHEVLLSNKSELLRRGVSIDSKLQKVYKNTFYYLTYFGKNFVADSEN